MRIPFVRMIGLLATVCGCIAGCGPAGSPGAKQGYPIDQPVQAVAWQFGPAQGKMLDTAHYRIFTTIDDPSIRGDIGGYMEACYAHYSALTGLEATGRPSEENAPESGDASHSPGWELAPTGLTGNKLPVYLLATRKQWAVLTQKVTGDYSETFLKINSGGYCFRGVCVFWDIGPLGTYSVAGHEGLHQFLHYATRQSLPSWAEEGLATQAEGFDIRDSKVFFDPARNVVRFSDLRKAISSNRWRSAAELVNMDAAENVRKSFLNGGEYYAQLWALLLMIRSDPAYSQGLRRMLSDAASGNLVQGLGIDPAGFAQIRHNSAQYNQVISPRVFAHYIDPDMARFERRYEQFARQLAGMK